MQVTVFSCRNYDELPEFECNAKELGLKLVLTNEIPTLDNVHLVEGSQCVDITTTPIGRELLKAYYDKGVRYIVTRCIGYDHIDVAAAKEIGITVANTPYGPDGVGDYTVMLMIMAMRHMKAIMARNARIKGYDRGCYRYRTHRSDRNAQSDWIWLQNDLL